MVLDKSIETLEDLVRFLNRKQSFYFKLYDRYLEGDYDRLDDSRKHEADCNAVCDDIVECIKAISDEAQVRGISKKVKILCTLDGQDEEKYILDEWLLKVVRLLDDKANWNRMLAPVEGKDMNNAFDAILFRLTYVANFLKELSTKTEQEYYGGRRTDVMPYYIGESKLKEHFFYAPPHHEEDEEDIIIGYIAAVRDYQTQKTKYVDDEGNVCNNKSQAKVFDIKGKADNYSYEHCPEGWTHFVVAVKKSDILKEAEITKYMACCYDPEDYYEETNYIDEDGELSCSSSGAKLFNTEDEAIEYAEDNRPYGWASFAMPFNTTLSEAIDDFPKNTRAMYRFAKQKHDTTGAIRKHSGDPYWVHPEGVAKIAAAYGGTDIEIQAAMAHDTLEDTNCSYDELEEMFGDEVASIVREITNDTEEVDRLGKEQYINLELINLSHPALFVKLCDMYYNQMDFPAEAQKKRMIKNINYLLANREDDLNENEIALIEDILQTLIY